MHTAVPYQLAGDCTLSAEPARRWVQAAAAAMATGGGLGGDGGSGGGGGGGNGCNGDNAGMHGDGSDGGDSGGGDGSAACCLLLPRRGPRGGLKHRLECRPRDGRQRRASRLTTLISALQASELPLIGSDASLTSTTSPPQNRPDDGRLALNPVSPCPQSA